MWTAGLSLRNVRYCHDILEETLLPVCYNYLCLSIFSNLFSVAKYLLTPVCECVDMHEWLLWSSYRVPRWWIYASDILSRVALVCWVTRSQQIFWDVTLCPMVCVSNSQRFKGFFMERKRTFFVACCVSPWITFSPSWVGLRKIRLCALKVCFKSGEGSDWSFFLLPFLHFTASIMTYSPHGDL